ncbi:hypothetical protein WN943_006156 [Citrus x changshan-huyou]
MLLQPCNERRESDDRISQFPVDILAIVVSRLTMKEAARTTTLSSRWRCLWNWFSGCLNFDNPLTMAHLKAKARLGLEGELLEIERLKFMSWLNQVLGSHQGELIEGLRICFDVEYSNDDINKVVELEGFDGLAVAELMMYLIESAELLEKKSFSRILVQYAVGEIQRNLVRGKQRSVNSKDSLLLSWQQNSL